MGPGDGIEFQKLIDLKNQHSHPRTTAHGAGAKMKQILQKAPMMRSTSTSSANAQQHKLVPSSAPPGHKQRPLSTHSKSSDGMY